MKDQVINEDLELTTEEKKAIKKLAGASVLVKSVLIPVLVSVGMLATAIHQIAQFLSDK